jgi:hypothetical protein
MIGWARGVSAAVSPNDLIAETVASIYGVPHSRFSQLQRKQTTIASRNCVGSLIAGNC